MSVQLSSGQSHPMDFFTRSNECAAEARHLMEKTTARVKEIAEERARANANMDEQEALLEAVHLISLGKKGFAYAFRNNYKDQPDLDNWVEVFVGNYTNKLGSDFALLREVQNILQRKA